MNTFQASTGPSARTSGQYGNPNGHHAAFGCASASGRKLYGSTHGARACSSWCPASQSRYSLWRWSPGAASPWPGAPPAMKLDQAWTTAGSVATTAATR